jgi:hypothetical protein
VSGAASRTNLGAGAGPGAAGMAMPAALPHERGSGRQPSSYQSLLDAIGLKGALDVVDGQGIARAAGGPVFEHDRGEVADVLLQGGDVEGALRTSLRSSS